MESDEYFVQNSETTLNLIVEADDENVDVVKEEDEKEHRQEIGFRLLDEFNDLIDDVGEDCNSSFSNIGGGTFDLPSRQELWSGENLWFDNKTSPANPLENGVQGLLNLPHGQQDEYSESNETTPHLSNEHFRTDLSTDYHQIVQGVSSSLNSTPCSNNSFEDPNAVNSEGTPEMGYDIINGQLYMCNPELNAGGLNPNAVPFASYTDPMKSLKHRQYFANSNNNFAMNYMNAERATNEWVNGEFDFEKDVAKYQYIDTGIIGNPSELVQLRILYDARGRELAKLKSEYEQEKDNHKFSLENVEDQLETLRGENEVLVARLNEFAELQDLLTEKEGRISALNGRISCQDANKLEVTKKLQIAESTISSLKDQISELEKIDTLSRSRAQHDLIVSNIQKKHDEESLKVKENMDALCAQLRSKTEEVNIVQQKLTEMSQAVTNRSETINQLTKSLEESQNQCQILLKGGAMNNQHDLHGNSAASKKLIASLQDEIDTLKDELELYENTSHITNNIQDDTINQLNIKRGASWRKPEESLNGSGTNNDLVSNLKHELERSLTSNRAKRSKLTKLQSDYRNNLRESELVKSQLACSEKQITSQQSKITNLQAKLNDLNPMGKESNMMTLRDIDKLQLEKEQLVEELEEVKRQLNAANVNERQLDQAVKQLHHQMTQLASENNEDRRQSLERSQQTYLQLHEESIKKIRKEMSQKHDDEITLMQEKFKDCQDELDSVKQIYVVVCQEKRQVECELEKAKVKVEETEKRLAEVSNKWKENVKEIRSNFELKVEEAIHQAQTKKSHQWQQNLDEIQAESEKETIHKIMEISHRLQIEKEEALKKLEEKKNIEFLREMKKINENAAKETQESLKALKQRMITEKEKTIELLENRWKENKLSEIKEIEEKCQYELQHLTDKLTQEKLHELKLFEEKRDRERKKLVQHVVVKKNKERHEQLKQLEERIVKQYQDELNQISMKKDETLERIVREKDGEIMNLKSMLIQQESKYDEQIKVVLDKAKHDKEMLFTLMEDVRRKEKTESEERDKAESLNELKAKEFQEKIKLLSDEKETEKKNQIMKMQTHYHSELEKIRKENEKLKVELNSIQTALDAKDNELADQHKEVLDALKLLEQMKSKERNNTSKSNGSENSMSAHDQRLNLDCLKSFQEQNNELLKLYKTTKEEYENEKAETLLNHNKAITLLKEKHLHMVKALRKEQKNHQIVEPNEMDTQHVTTLRCQVSKLDAELKVHQAKVRELETQVSIKNGQLETLEEEQNVGMKHVEIQMQLMIQELQAKLEERHLEMERVKKQHEDEMKEFQKKMIENASQDADVERKMSEIVTKMQKNEESLGLKVHELQLGLENKKTQVQLITLKANQEIEKLKNELEKANREKEQAKLSPQFGMRHFSDKSHQERTQLKAKLRQCQKFAQNREMQHQMAIVKLQQEHTTVVKELEEKMENLKKTSMEYSIQEIANVHRAQVKALKEQYSAELNAVHQQYASELDTVQGLVQHYQVMYKQLVESDCDNMIEIQDSIKQVVGALQKDLFQYLNGLNKRVAQRIHTEVMKERRMIVARLKEQFGIKETKELELSILHSEIEAQLHVEPGIDSWATVSRSEGFLSANAECDRIASCLDLKREASGQDHLSKLLKQMSKHSSSNDSLKGQKLEASCLRYKTPIVDKFGHEIVPLRSAFSVDHIHHSNVKKDDAEKRTTEKKMIDSGHVVTSATREQPVGQSASETVVSKSNKLSVKKGSPRSNRTTVGNSNDGVQALGKKQGDDLKELLDKVPQSERCNIDRGIQKILESKPELLTSLIESFQNHLKDKNYINKMCHCRTVNEKQLKSGDNCASKTFVPLETESDSSVSVKGVWTTTDAKDYDKQVERKDKQWVRKPAAYSIDK